MKTTIPQCAAPAGPSQPAASDGTGQPRTLADDMRLSLAREFLDGARRRKVTTLPPSVLVRECAELRCQLGQVLDVIDQADDDTEPYCTRCGQWAGTFLGMDGWHHFRGDPAPGGQRELYDAGHEAVIGWMVPPGRAISPARMAMLAAALDDAATFRTERAGRWCDDCQATPDECCQAHACKSFGETPGESVARVACL